MTSWVEGADKGTTPMSKSTLIDLLLLAPGSVASGPGGTARFRFFSWLAPGGYGGRRPPTLVGCGVLGRSSASCAPRSASLSALAFPLASLLFSVECPLTHRHTKLVSGSKVSSQRKSSLT